MLKTFRLGGVHPEENKISAEFPTETLPIPQTVYIPIAQHIGAPAKPVVSRGDEVKTGQLIAEAAGFVSANIHSSVSGTVKKVDTYIDNSGYRKPVIIVDVKGDEWINTIDRTEELKKDINLSGKEIIEKVKEAGLVGLGGATFPTHVKLSVPPSKKCEYFLVNGVECEPFLTSDHRMMLEKTEELMIGIEIVKKALGVDTAIVGIENNKPDAIKKMEEVAENYSGIEVQALKVKYPQGGEKQLTKALINREVPSGALPIDVGVVALNVGSVFAVYEAVQKNKPLFERLVTVTGKSVVGPGTFKTRVGTPLNDLIAAGGGMPSDTSKIINGGPMMGKSISTPDIPVVKGSSGIVIMNEKEAKRGEEGTCIRCGKCVTACPMGLEPYLLEKLSRKNMFDELEDNKIMDCMECGSCSFTCPSNLPLIDYLRLGKFNVGKIIKSRNK